MSGEKHRILLTGLSIIMTASFKWSLMLVGVIQPCFSTPFDLPRACKTILQCFPFSSSIHSLFPTSVSVDDVVFHFTEKMAGIRREHSSVLYLSDHCVPDQLLLSFCMTWPKTSPSIPALSPSLLGYLWALLQHLSSLFPRAPVFLLC